MIFYFFLKRGNTFDKKKMPCSLLFYQVQPPLPPFPPPPLQPNQFISISINRGAEFRNRNDQVQGNNNVNNNDFQYHYIPPHHQMRDDANKSEPEFVEDGREIVNNQDDIYFNHSSKTNFLKRERSPTPMFASSSKRSHSSSTPSGQFSRQQIDKEIERERELERWNSMHSFEDTVEDDEKYGSLGYAVTTTTAVTTSDSYRTQASDDHYNIKQTRRSPDDRETDRVAKTAFPYKRRKNNYNVRDDDYDDGLKKLPSYRESTTAMTNDMNIREPMLWSERLKQRHEYARLTQGRQLMKGTQKDDKEASVNPNTILIPLHEERSTGREAEVFLPKKMSTYCDDVPSKKVWSGDIPSKKVWEGPPTITCKYWKMGRCNKGSACPFLHDFL